MAEKKMRRRSVFVDDELWAAVKLAAKMDDRKPASYVRKALRGWLALKK